MANDLVQRRSDPVIEEMRREYYGEPATTSSSSYSPMTQSIVPIIDLGMDAAAAIVSDGYEKRIQLIQDQKERVWDRVKQKGDENYALTLENIDLRYQLELAEIEKRYANNTTGVKLAGGVFFAILLGGLMIL